MSSSLTESKDSKELLIDPDENRQANLIKEQKELKINKIVNAFKFNNDAYLNANFISKIFFYWGFKAVKVHFTIIVKII